VGEFWNPHDMPDAALVECFMSVFGKMAEIGNTSQKMAENEQIQCFSIIFHLVRPQILPHSLDLASPI
jgi:hypothetical protein